VSASGRWRTILSVDVASGVCGKLCTCIVARDGNSNGTGLRAERGLEVRYA
jgi:hypothetical protein